MNYTIKNDFLSLTVSDIGAEMQSIKGNDTEYLWQGDPEYWSGRAYNLFPICGRLWNNEYIYNGKEYEMNIHGFARKMTFTVIKHTENALIFSISDNDETFAQYPFKFDFSVEYRFNNNKIEIIYTVKNNGDNIMPLTLGGHPGFNVPLDIGKFEDWYLEFSAYASPKILDMKSCYMTDNLVDFSLVDGKYKALSHDMFDDDAIFITDMAKGVTIKSKKSDRSISLEYNDFKYLGFWHKPNSDAPYICIEPWNGVPSYHGKIDDILNKRDMIKLNPDKTYTAQISIIVK
ncbi:MAG: aldose 1-epimerase family protein [Oscillospiraceae bacterium]|nr:aldose 1-epimerase family protein [Candidatus Equicaccousia limihippi]